ncbi:4-hydroxythreonine-4-phosphate dehydrogenase PdxA [Anaerococcus sp. AGMB09787]|uniref:4-hydroxythreonine-4-phosphate dehydrogenase PdxA n=1 Tax=Anaerococcus sp. AGMB09787 TaxID=2922869 RepID=UPI001FAFE7C2|nr:4-hydroxythreonine-4-phosphate dehydrogenase PdxA [Anaerococcus sp. AGMB09787]
MKENIDREYVLVPIGDPAGIGPEISVKALKYDEVNDKAKVILIGDKKVIDRTLEITKTNQTINIIDKFEDGIYDKNTINLIDLDNMPANYKYGEVNADCARASYDYIEKAYQLCDQNYSKVMATTPINKESFKAAKIPFIGHTGILEHLSEKKDLLTMFEVRNLRVFFYSKHISLREACDLISKEGIKDYVYKSIDALKRIGIKEPNFAVAGLNPHSGEHGLFGNEEVDFIMPAVEELRNEGVDVEGPIGADSVFYQALCGKYDGVLSLYHDQGHIATKMVDFNRTISITHNLPFLRTSVDHGTAFDIAGKNIADETSMVEAIKLAGKYAHYFKSDI